MDQQLLSFPETKFLKKRDDLEGVATCHRWSNGSRFDYYGSSRSSLTFNEYRNIYTDQPFLYSLSAASAVCFFLRFSKIALS